MTVESPVFQAGLDHFVPDEELNRGAILPDRRTRDEASKGYWCSPADYAAANPPVGNPDAGVPADDEQPPAEPVPGPEILTHRVNPCNAHLKIVPVGERGPGGAYGAYDITGFDTSSNPASVSPDGFRRNFSRLPIVFHTGPVEAGVNGITNEALLAIVRDRLQGFQTGPYACEENEMAMVHLDLAAMTLKSRTERRDAAGIEGTLAIDPAAENAIEFKDEITGEESYGELRFIHCTTLRNGQPYSGRVEVWKGTELLGRLMPSDAPPTQQPAPVLDATPADPETAQALEAEGVKPGDEIELDGQRATLTAPDGAGES